MQYLYHQNDTNEIQKVIGWKQVGIYKRRHEYKDQDQHIGDDRS